ncbi:hypothetical protein PILCRDRAFT_830519 [Piloderma croceum F 1598]|uniref:Uncharacterized protein n=1 Tax=Piloderma croceum (strain F 1598) TaxID=765440 RepID=A0A0C3EEU8_PILCF|nr:hypothetical protein PILCRDRAFT_830519 [Piloderma croceum F 1598]
MILLRVVSAMSMDKMDVNIIPEFPIAKTTFSGSHSFGGVVDLLLTKLPSQYTRYLLLDPTSALGNPEAIDGPTTSNFFEAKQDNNGGGRVACSDEFSLGEQLEGLPLILGLLADWVDHATQYDQKFFTYK